MTIQEIIENMDPDFFEEEIRKEYLDRFLKYIGDDDDEH